MTALVRAGVYVAEAHASWSRWVARCGLCPSGEQLYPFTPHGFNPPTHFRCRECGTATEVIWPSEEMVRGVERILMMRPDPSTRSWFPGETLNDLMWENGAHGVLDHLDQLELGCKPGDMLFAVEETRIRVDNLPALKSRIRQQIGT